MSHLVRGTRRAGVGMRMCCGLWGCCALLRTSGGLGLTPPVGAASQRLQTHVDLCHITRHHVIVVTKFVVVASSKLDIHRPLWVSVRSGAYRIFSGDAECAWWGLPRATLRAGVLAGDSQLVAPHRSTSAQDYHRRSHETQADFVVNGSPVHRLTPISSDS
eukprot:7376500-Prymnesium_polylepis.2